MTRCDTCDGCVGYCSCDNEEPVRWRQVELSDFVWDFNMLVNVEEEEEVADE